MRSTAIFVVFFTVCSASQGSATPFRPPTDGTILEQLPYKPNDPVLRELRQLRADLMREPNNLQVAVRLARRYYEMVSAEGDPRYLGYAQAALEPWWRLPNPPVAVLVLRASIHQYRHDFDAALADLSQAIKLNPRNAEAWSLRAAINIVQARYEQGKQDCMGLHGLTSDLMMQACVSTVDGLTGRLAQGYETLRGSLEKSPQATADEKLWVFTRLAEMAQRMGHYELAEGYFKQALALGKIDGFLLAAYADFLLDHKRPAEVVPLLKGMNRSDILLLRLALAEKALGTPDAVKHQADMQARFDAARLRGDKVHRQEEARFTLYFLKKPAAAVKLAAENWEVQRESRDARIFMEAALAANDAQAAHPAVAWVTQNHIEDAYLIKLADQVKALSK